MDSSDSITRNVRRTMKPHDDLTRLAGQMVDQLARPGLRAVVVMLSTDERGGMAASGSDDEVKVIADVIGHLEAWAKSRGYPLTVQLGKARDVH